MKRVRFCGGPMTFSGPVQPPMLGAALASARIHLSEDLPTFQAELLAKIAYCNRLLTEHELPVISASEAPIRFIGMGLPRVALNLAKRLMGEGLYVNVAQFPAVPMRRAGIRFTITRHQTESDIKRLVEAIAHHLPYSLSEEGGSLEEISRAFKISLPSIPLERRIPQAKGALTLQHERTIHAFSPDKWDSLLGNNGIFSHQGLETLEQVFCGHPEPENNWDFHYYVVREADGTPVLATFFTGGLWKDDMLSPSSTSALVERSRKNDPYFLTSKTLAMGSLLSEGQHLYLDRGRNWQEAMRMLLEAVESERENQQASRVILRDLPSDDPEMDVFLLDQGFSKYPLPETAVVDVNWTSEEEYLRTLSYRSRRQQRREVLDWEQQCQIELLPKAGRPLTEAEVEHFHQLYLNVKGRNLSLNTFDLPKSLWSHLQAAPCWELLTLTVKPEYGGPSDGRPVAVTANYVGAEAYVPLIIGLDYDYAHSFHAYRQFLLQTIRRANLHGSRRIYLGFGAPLEKQRLGARLEVPAIYVQMTDHFNAEILSQLMADSFGKVG